MGQGRARELGGGETRHAVSSQGHGGLLYRPAAHGVGRDSATHGEGEDTRVATTPGPRALEHDCYCVRQALRIPRAGEYRTFRPRCGDAVRMGLPSARMRGWGAGTP